jgi:4-amino-4-deoxy-L-arabinose transferase-like glycosyltransferase
MSKRVPPLTDEGFHKSHKVTAGALLISGVGFLLLAVLPYPAARQLGDLLARDGSLELLTPALWKVFQGVLGISGLLLSGCAVIALRFPHRFKIAAVWLKQTLTNAFQNLPADAKRGLDESLNSLRQPEIWLPAAALLVVGLVIRGLFVNVPMEHDEAYTFSVFAVQPLRLGLSDYHYPNNHLFHTLLVHLSYRLFGVQPWTVRLPALIAGALLAPFGYGLARRLYSPAAGWLAGLTIALAPVLVSFSVNARGYTLLALFTLWNAGLAVYLLRQGNAFHWLLLALFGALGLYTVPVFVYSLAMLYFWLFLVWVSGKVDRSRRFSFPLAVLLCGSLTVLLAGLFYLPVFLNSGIKSVVANQWVEPVAREWFLPTLQSRVTETWQEWTRFVHPALVGLFGLGWMIGLIFHSRLSRLPIPLQAGLVILPVIVFIQRPNPWARIWLFLVPLMLIWAAAGLAYLIETVSHLFKNPSRIRSGLLAMFSIILLAGSVIYIVQRAPLGERRYGGVEQSLRFIQPHLQSGDLVIITAPEDAPLWYYFYQYNLPRQMLRRDIPFRRAFVLVSTAHQQTLEQVIRERGPDYGFFDFSTARRLAGFGHMDVYLIEADHQAIERYYGSDPP